MNVRLNLEIKSFCPDFRPIRKALRAMGATPMGRKEQVDYFFVLPESPRRPPSRRLKLRMDAKGPRLIYYYDRNQPDSRLVEFQVAKVDNPLIKDVLEAALGVRAVVKKRREVWKKGAATFNLDMVEGVGTIFEVEIEDVSGEEWRSEIGRYRKLFGPYLGEEIAGSNEDLVTGSTRPSSPSVFHRQDD